MAEIERHVEVEARTTHPDYSGREFTDEEIAGGLHRTMVGGRWDDRRGDQLEFLTSRGMLPEHRLLDVGCGVFRAGRHFIDYLEPAHYFGIDANHALMQTGYDLELSDAQRARLPIENLRNTDRFFGEFGVEFDYAIANSVFSHISLNHVRLCLYRLAPVMKPGGSFYATFFERKNRFPLDEVSKPTKKGKAYFTEKNLFWYYRGDLRWAASFGPWKVRYVGDWGHPANQKMMQFIKMTEAEVASRDRKLARAKEAARTPAVAPPAPPPPSLRADLRRHAGRGRRWLRRRLTRSG